MKRLLGLMLLIMVLVGCGEANAPPAESSPTTPHVTEAFVSALENFEIKRNARGEIVAIALANTQELVHLKGLTKLQELRLNSTQVTDAGLVHLKGLTNLYRLLLYANYITDAGVAELTKALPNCDISCRR